MQAGCRPVHIEVGPNHPAPTSLTTSWQLMTGRHNVRHWIESRTTLPFTRSCKQAGCSSESYSSEYCPFVHYPTSGLWRSLAKGLTARSCSRDTCACSHVDSHKKQASRVKEETQKARGQPARFFHRRLIQKLV